MFSNFWFYDHSFKKAVEQYFTVMLFVLPDFTQMVILENLWNLEWKGKSYSPWNMRENGFSSNNISL